MRWVPLHLPFPGESTGAVSLVCDKLQEAKSETLLYLCGVKSMQVNLSCAAWEKHVLNLLEIKTECLGSPYWIAPHPIPVLGSWEPTGRHWWVFCFVKETLGSLDHGDAVPALRQNVAAYPVRPDGLHAVSLGFDLKVKFVSASKLFCSRGNWAAVPHHHGPWLSRTWEFGQMTQLNRSSALKLPFLLLYAE